MHVAIMHSNKSNKHGGRYGIVAIVHINRYAKLVVTVSEAYDTS